MLEMFSEAVVTKRFKQSTNLQRKRRLLELTLISLLVTNMILVDLIDATSIAASHVVRKKQFAQRANKKPRMHPAYNSDVEAVQLMKPSASAVSSNYQHYHRQSHPHTDRWKKPAVNARNKDADFDSGNNNTVTSKEEDEMQSPAEVSGAANEDKLEISVRVNGHAAPDVSVYKLPAEWLLNSQKTSPVLPPPPPPSSPPWREVHHSPPSVVPVDSASHPSEATTTTPGTSSGTTSLSVKPAAVVTIVTTEEPEAATSESPFLGAGAAPEAPPPPPPPPQQSKLPAGSSDVLAEQQAQLVQQQHEQQQALQQQAQQLQAVQQQLAKLEQQVSHTGDALPSPPADSAAATTVAPSLAAASITSSTSSTQYNVLLASPNAADEELKRLIEEPDECSAAPTQFSDAMDDSRFFSPDSVQTEETPADAKWASEKAFLFALPENTKLQDEDPSHYFQILFPQPYKLYGWRVRGFAGAVDGDNGGLAAYQAQVFDSSSKRWVHILDDAGEARIFSAMPTFKTNAAGELANEIYPVELSVPITDVAGLRIYPMQWIHKPYFKISVNGCPLTVVSSSAVGGSPTISAVTVGVTNGPHKSKRMIAHRPMRARPAAFELEEDTQPLRERESGESDSDDAVQRQNNPVDDGENALRASEPVAPEPPPAVVDSPNIELHFPHPHRRRKLSPAELARKKQHLQMNHRFDAHDDTAPTSPLITTVVNKNDRNVSPAQVSCEARLLQMSDGLNFYRVDHGQQVRNLHSTPDLSSSSKRGWIAMRLLATPPSVALQDAEENKLFGLEIRFTKGAYVEKLIIASAVREPDLTSIVTAFTVQFLKLNDDEWQWVRDPAATQDARVFELPVDSEASPQQMLQGNYTLDFSFRSKLGALRIFPQRWYRFPGFRVGLLGCVDA